LREALICGTAPEIEAALNEVEREGLMTTHLLESLMARDGLTDMQLGPLRDRRKLGFGTAPPAVGRVWTVYLLSTRASDAGTLPPDIPIPIPLTCIFSRTGTASRCTQRTALWVDGLKRVEATAGDAIARYLSGIEPAWAEGCMQFDLDPSRTHGNISEEDRSYELAALTAAFASAFGLAPPTGTAALGLIGSDLDPISQFPLIEPLPRDVMALKLRGLVRSLPVLQQVFVPRCDAEFARALIGARQVSVVDVQSVFDVIIALDLRDEQFLGRRRQTAFTRLRDQFLKIINLTPTPRVLGISADERPATRLVLGRTCGIACALMTVALSTTISAALQLNAPRAKELFVDLPLLAFIPIISELRHHKSGRDPSVRTFHLVARVLATAVCAELTWLWRLRIDGEPTWLLLLLLSFMSYLIRDAAAFILLRSTRNGVPYALPYLNAYLATCLFFGAVGIITPAYLWTMQALCIAYGIVASAVLSRIRWRVHSSRLLSSIRLLFGLTWRFLMVTIPVTLYLMLFQWIHLRMYAVALRAPEFPRLAYPFHVWITSDPLKPLGAGVVHFPLMGLLAFLCSFAVSKTSCVFFGSSIVSSEEVTSRRSGELATVAPIDEGADDLAEQEPPLPSASPPDPLPPVTASIDPAVRQTRGNASRHRTRGKRR